MHTTQTPYLRLTITPTQVRGERVETPTGRRAVECTIEHAHTLPAQTFLENCRGVLLACVEAGETVSHLALRSSARSLLLIGRENARLTPIHFAEEPTLLKTLLHEHHPDVRRAVSAGALFVNWLGGEWLEHMATPPLGLPLNPSGDYKQDPEVWRTLGIRWRSVPMLIPAGGVMTQVLPHRARALNVDPFLPVIAG